MKPSEQIIKIAKRLHDEVYGTNVSEGMKFWPETMIDAILEYLDKNKNI